jgi:GNAT superfamily N-acetyltransferase
MCSGLLPIGLAKAWRLVLSLTCHVNQPLLIRDLGPDDAIEPITVLLHAAYRALANLGFRYFASHQDDATTRRRLCSGFPLIAELDGVIVATVTLYATAVQSDCAWYVRPGVFRFGQFAVRPDLQREGLGSRLLRIIEQRAGEKGATELALDTAEGATHLRCWYERLGFRFVEYVSWPETNYRSVVLSKQLGGDGQR